jgi:hypothetical protein
MSPPGRPKGESPSAQRAGKPSHPPGRPKGESPSAQRAGSPVAAPADAASASGRICPNCHVQRLPGARFCHGCGQPAWDRTPTVRQMLREYGAQYVGTEGALWRTLGLLLRPGRLTVEYLRGRRRRYLHPLRLYLSASVLCFLLLQVGSLLSFDSRRTEPVSPGDKAELDINLGPGNVRFKPGGGFECDLSNWICARLKRRYAVEPQRLMIELEGLRGRFASFMPYALFLLVPLFAALMQLVHLGRRLHYAEHLVFALHLHAFWFTGLWLAAVAPQPIKGALILFLLSYGVLAMRTVYGGRWGATLLRAAVVSPLYLVLLLAVTVAVVAAAALL